MENELNERFLRKNDVELLNGILASTQDTENRKTKIQFAESVRAHRVDSNAAVTPTVRSSENSLILSDGDSHSRRASSISSMGTFQKKPTDLSFVIKTGICENEREVECAALDKFEQNMKIQFTDLMAEIEEIKLSSHDVCYAREMFEDFVILKGEKTVACRNFLESKTRKV